MTELQKLVTTLQKSFITKLLANPDWNPFDGKSEKEIQALNKIGVFGTEVDLESEIPIIIINTTDRKDFKAVAPSIWDFSIHKRLKGTSDKSVIFSYMRDPLKCIMMAEAEPDAEFYLITNDPEWLNKSYDKRLYINTVALQNAPVLKEQAIA